MAQTVGGGGRFLTANAVNFPRTPPPARPSAKGPERFFPFFHPAKVFPLALLGSGGTAEPDSGDSKTPVTPVTFSSGPPLVSQAHAASFFFLFRWVLAGGVFFFPPHAPPRAPPPPGGSQGCQVSSAPSDCDDLRLAESILQAAWI